MAVAVTVAVADEPVGAGELRAGDFACSSKLDQPPRGGLLRPARVHRVYSIDP